jgi:hypothetical protein
MNKPFWKYMIAKGDWAYNARRMLSILSIRDLQAGPVWCFDRFGISTTWLPDGRIILIGGEHEDFYDPDFYIYSDVIVIRPAAEPEMVDAWVTVDLKPEEYTYGPRGDGTTYTIKQKSVEVQKRVSPPKPEEITIYGYPRSVFPPTDFHVAVHVGAEEGSLGGGCIYVIGGVGYRGKECVHKDGTNVYRLDLESFKMERVATTGQAPPHDVDSVKKRKAHLRDREIVTEEMYGEKYLLDLNTMAWRRLEDEVAEPEPGIWEEVYPGSAWKVSEDLEKGYL